MNPDQIVALLTFAGNVIAGEIKTPADVARGLIGLALDLAPVDELAPYLTAEARRRDDLIVDAAEIAKVGV
jgi:hypothetical protein